MGQVLQRRKLFKIDTVTGWTWYYVSVELKGTLMKKWIEMWD